jgi:hypothetical protein
MNRIRQNIRLTIILTLSITISVVFVVSASLTAGEPDSLALKIEKPQRTITPAIDKKTDNNNVSFADRDRAPESGNNNFSDGNKLQPKQPTRDEGNMQDSYTGQTIFSSALSIIYKLLQYFL